MFEKKAKVIDLWGVDMPEAQLLSMRGKVNSDVWKQCFEPWFNAQIAFVRSKNDTATGDELLRNQAEIKWLKRLANMREDFNSYKLQNKS